MVNRFLPKSAQVCFADIHVAGPSLPDKRNVARSRNYQLTLEKILLKSNEREDQNRYHYYFQVIRMIFYILLYPQRTAAR